MVGVEDSFAKEEVSASRLRPVPADDLNASALWAKDDGLLRGLESFKTTLGPEGVELFFAAPVLGLGGKY